MEKAKVTVFKVAYRNLAVHISLNPIGRSFPWQLRRLNWTNLFEKSTNQPLFPLCPWPALSRTSSPHLYLLILALCRSLSRSASVKPYLETLDQPLRSFVDVANRNECFSDFSKQKTAKERWRSLVPRMGDREEYLEMPLPLPPSLYGRTYGRTLVRWRHNQIFSAWWVTNFSYPWCFAGALCALKLRYNTNYDVSSAIHCKYGREVESNEVFCQKCGTNKHTSTGKSDQFRRQEAGSRTLLWKGT